MQLLVCQGWRLTERVHQPGQARVIHGGCRAAAVAPVLVATGGNDAPPIKLASTLRLSAHALNVTGKPCPESCPPRVPRLARALGGPLPAVGGPLPALGGPLPAHGGSVSHAHTSPRAGPLADPFTFADDRASPDGPSVEGSGLAQGSAALARSGMTTEEHKAAGQRGALGPGPSVGRQRQPPSTVLHRTSPRRTDLRGRRWRVHPAATDAPLRRGGGPGLQRRHTSAASGRAKSTDVVDEGVTT